LQVQVRDNNVDQALRVLKKRLQREGVFREMKLRKYFEKPSDARVRRKAYAIRPNLTAARDLAFTNGLIAAPKRA
jgi:small subunit ribosomal protein S21